MNRNLCILILLVSGAAVYAQQVPAGDTPPARPAVPSGPLLKPAPDFSGWEIDFIYPDDQTKPDRPPSRTELAVRLRHVITTKTGKIVHESSLYASGKKVETWYNGKMRYEKQEGAGFWKAQNGGTGDTGANTDDLYVVFPSNGFRDLDWINAKTYVGTLPYGDRAYLAFVPSGADKIDQSDPGKLKKLLDAQETVAYIDSETRLPISLRTGKVVRSYHFLAPPTEMQTLPTDLAGEIKRGEDARIRLNQLAPRPY